MRREISKHFRVKSAKSKIVLAVIIIFIFVIANGAIIYSFNPSNYYFYLVKKVIPYPAFLFGKNIVSISSYEDEILLNKKIYESAYRIDFSSKDEGKKNYDNLRKNVRDEILDRTIMENSLKDLSIKITSKDIKQEYDNMTKSIGSDKEIADILKYSSNISEKDIKTKIYMNLLKESVQEHILYGLDMKILSLKPEDKSNNEEWDTLAKKVDTIYSDIARDSSEFDKYYVLYNSKNDDLVNDSQSTGYYNVNDLPEAFHDVFYSINVGQISKPIKTDAGYYIIKVDAKRGYYRGTIEKFLKEQKEKLKVWSFIH